MGVESLYREIAERAVRGAGGRALLRPADAIQMINRAAEAGVPIVQVGGLPLGSGEPRRSALAMVDFSASVADGHGCWTQAEAFIQRRVEDGLGFELTLGDDPINAA
jgi:hypothetical protein